MIVYGRVTDQMMAGYWPTAGGSSPSVATPLNGALREEVAKLNNDSGNDMVSYGSGSIVQRYRNLPRSTSID